MLTAQQARLKTEEVIKNGKEIKEIMDLINEAILKGESIIDYNDLSLGCNKILRDMGYRFEYFFDINSRKLFTWILW